MSKRSRRCARGVAALGLLACALAACSKRAPQITTQQFDLIQRQLAVREAAPTQPTTPPAQGAEPAAEKPPPPRNDAERRERATAALAPGAGLGDVEKVGDGTRWVLSLATVKRDGEAQTPHLTLIDVSRSAGTVVGEHEFDVERERGGMPMPSKIGRVFYLDASTQPVVLAELLVAGDGEPTLFGFCGWSLVGRPEFQCAPRLGPSSRFDFHSGQIVESWTVDSVGGRIDGNAGTRSGRVLRFADGRWVETDSFRCLGRPLPEAFKEAGQQTIAGWQHETVRRLTQAAKRSSDALETDVALARLQEALVVDGCAPEVWRVLGRLEFEAGRPKAVATLAVAVALAPRDDGVTLDLADALAVLDTRRPEQQESWHTAVAVLGSRAATRPLVEGPSSKSPRALALALYGAFLARTSPTDAWLTARRRKVEEKMDALQGKAARR